MKKRTRRCRCENCDVQFLQNISECYCCCELDGCVEALVSDIVLQDLPGAAQSQPISCDVFFSVGRLCHKKVSDVAQYLLLSLERCYIRKQRTFLAFWKH